MEGPDDQRPHIKGIITCTGKETWDFVDAMELKGKVEVYMLFCISHIKAQMQMEIKKMHDSHATLGQTNIDEWYGSGIAGPTIVVN